MRPTLTVKNSITNILAILKLSKRLKMATFHRMFYRDNDMHNNNCRTCFALYLLEICQRPQPQKVPETNIDFIISYSNGTRLERCRITTAGFRRAFLPHRCPPTSKRFVYAVVFVRSLVAKTPKTGGPGPNVREPENQINRPVDFLWYTRRDYFRTVHCTNTQTRGAVKWNRRVTTLYAGGYRATTTKSWPDRIEFRAKINYYIVPENASKTIDRRHVRRRP